MADSKNISSLGLDIGPYLDALGEAAQAYKNFAKVLSQTLAVRIDPTSITQLSQAIGVQMRQATTLVKNANKETVADSVAAAKKVSQEYGKIAGTGEAAFKRMRAEAKKAAEEIGKDAKNIGNAGKLAGDGFANGIAAGAQRAKQEIASTAAAAKSAAIAHDQWAKGQRDRAFQTHRRLEKELGKAATSLGGRRALSSLQDKLGSDITDTPLRKHLETGKWMVDTQGVAERIDRIRSAMRELQVQTGLAGDSLARFGREGTRQFPKFIGPTTSGPVQMSDFEGLANSLAWQLQQSRPGPYNRLVKNPARQAPGSVTTHFPFLDPVALHVRNKPPDSAHDIMPGGGGRRSLTDAKERLDVEKRIGDSLLRNSMFLAKYVVLYRLVHDTARAVENALIGFVKSGIDYTKELETQQIALRGILAENFKISVNQGQQLSGMAAVTALQTTAVVQWRQIQQASLSVVGTTADLMQLYTGIMPFAAQLGADLDKIQKLTKDTAVAARLLDISFQDARSGMVALLQGRALTRNRLVGALGFTKEDIESLRGTPQLLDAISAKLSDFSVLADEAQMTVAAMSEAIKDFSGVIASGFTTPLTNAFKKFVGSLTETNGAFALFQKTAGGLQIKEDVQAFINFTTAAMTQALAPVREFGKALREGIGENARDWVLALRDVATVGIELATTITKLVLGMASWIANNRLLIKDLAMLALAGVVAIGVRRLDMAIRGAAAASSLLSRLLGLGGREFETFSMRQLKAKGAADAASSAMSRLGSGLASFGRGALLGAALYGLEQIIAKFERMRQRAAAVADQVRAMSGGDVGAFVTSAVETLKPDATVTQKADTIGRIGDFVGNQASALAARFGGWNEVDAVTAARTHKQKLADLSKQQKAVSDEVTGLYVQIAKASASEKASLQKKLQAKLAEDASLKGQIVDIGEAHKRARDLSNNILTLQGLRPQIDETVRTLQGERNPQSQSTLRALIQNILRPDPRHMERLMAEPSLAQMLRKAIDEKMAAGTKARRLFDIFEQSSLPDLDPIERTESPEPKLKWVDMAPDIARGADRGTALEISNIRLKMAERVDSEEQTARMIEQIEVKLLEDKIKIWEREAERWEAFVKQKAAAGEPLTNDEIVDKRNSFKAAMADASADYQIKLNEIKQAEIKREQDFAAGLADANAKYVKSREEIFGSTEDTAAAKFAKELTDIEQALGKFANHSSEAKQKVAGLISAFKALQGPKLLQAGFEATINRTNKELDSARTLQKILQQDLENGQVTVEHYLARIAQLRNQQVSALAQQAGAYSGLAGQRQQGIDAEFATGKPDLEKVGRMAAEMSAFNAQAAAAKQEMADILSMARRIETAIQAWENLTSRLHTFLAAADGLQGTNTALSDMVNLLGQGAGLLNRIVSSADAFAKLPKAFNTFRAAFSDANGAQGIGGSFRALGGLFGIGGGARGPVSFPVSTGEGAGSFNTSQPLSAAGQFMRALPAIGIGISAALSIGSLIFGRAVERAKKDIRTHFEAIGRAFADGNLTLGEYLRDLQVRRQALIAQHSRSKSGRSALKELLPDIDNAIADAKRQAKQAQQAFEDMFARMKMGTGVFGDFARDLLDLQKTINDYLNSIDTSTTQGLKKYQAALEQVGEFRDLWFRQAKAKMQEELLGFESEALSAQERYFSLINEQAGLFTQLRDISEQRVGLEEAMADEEERRADFQKKLTDMAQRELEIRKQIAEVIRRAAEQENEIRRRGILEAQLSVAQQKAMEINQLRNEAAEQIDDLRRQLEDLQDQAKDEKDDEEENRKRKDRDFEIQKRNLNERESEVNKQIRLNKLRIDGARRVAEIEGGIFGMAADEFDLVVRQNDIQTRQAELQVQRWKDTKALVDSIVESANGIFFDPPDGFPQIHVRLGDIIIDNRDQSTVTVTGGRGTGEPGDPPPFVPPSRDPDSRPPRRKLATDSTASSFTAFERQYVR